MPFVTVKRDMSVTPETQEGEPKREGSQQTPKERLLLFLRKSTCWTRIREASSLRALQTSYFWLLFVPAAAKVLAPVQGKTVSLKPISDDWITEALNVSRFS